MRVLLMILSMFIITGLAAQKDSTTRKGKFQKAEVLTSGFIDILNNGQVNASARFIRLYIGEPGKFKLPLSIYSGVSSNHFQNQFLQNKSNETLATNFINPLAGITNLSIDGILFVGPDSTKITRPGILYHLGQRILTGIRTGLLTDPMTGKPVNILNSYGSIGLYLQTGAWDRSDSRNLGVTWLAIRFIGCYTGPRQLKRIIPNILTNGFYHGYSIAWGVEISNFVNSRLVYYNYLKKPEIEFQLPVYLFSFNYSLKK